MRSLSKQLNEELSIIHLKIRKKIIGAAILTLLAMVLSGFQENIAIATFQTACYILTVALIIRSYEESKALKTVKMKVKNVRSND